jgi:uncharacterized protein
MTGSARPLALVTGASSGIGADLARELAKDGHDLVLSARSLAPMQALAADLEAHGANSTVIPADLGRPGGALELVNAIEARGLQVDVLVNNAGLGGIGRFDQMDTQRVSDMLQINVLALTELTRLLLPGMVARKRGKVLLVGSTASFQPGPRMAVYFSTKAYVLSFGEALSQELKGSGVTVNVLCPGATATNFFEVAGGRTLSAIHRHRMMSAAKVARIGYRGLIRGERVTIAGPMNRILAFAARHIPHFLTLPITDRLLKGSEL